MIVYGEVVVYVDNLLDYLDVMNMMSRIFSRLWIRCHMSKKGQCNTLLSTANSLDAMIFHWDVVDHFLWGDGGAHWQSLGLSRGYANMMPRIKARAVQYFALVGEFDEWYLPSWQQRGSNNADGQWIECTAFSVMNHVHGYNPLTETCGGSGAAAAVTTMAKGTVMLHDLGNSDATTQITSWGRLWLWYHAGMRKGT